jgi:hypothetical protein
MRLLSEVCPDGNEVLRLRPEELGPHVATCLAELEKRSVERVLVARLLASGYNPNMRHDIAVAIEAAIDWLITQCVLGSDPLDSGLIVLTRPSKKDKADFKAN